MKDFSGLGPLTSSHIHVRGGRIKEMVQDRYLHVASICAISSELEGHLFVVDLLNAI